MTNGSHVHRLLLHVHMYIMYFLSVVLVLDKDVIRLCSYRVKSEGSYRWSLRDKNTSVCNINMYLINYIHIIFLLFIVQKSVKINPTTTRKIKKNMISLL